MHVRSGTLQPKVCLFFLVLSSTPEVYSVSTEEDPISVVGPVPASPLPSLDSITYTKTPSGTPNLMLTS